MGIRKKNHRQASPRLEEMEIYGLAKLAGREAAEERRQKGSERGKKGNICERDAIQGVSQQLPRKKSIQFIDEKGYEKNEHSISEVIHCSFVGDSVLSTVSSLKTLVKANSQVLIFKKLKSILHFIFLKF